MDQKFNLKVTFIFKLHTNISLVLLRYNNGADIKTVVTNPSYIDNAVIDTLWTRVRIPIADLGITAPTNVSKVLFGNANFGLKTYFIDELRFAGNVAPEQVSKFKAGNIKKYGTAICTETDYPMGFQNIHSTGDSGNTDNSGNNIAEESSGYRATITAYLCLLLVLVVV